MRVQGVRWSPFSLDGEDYAVDAEDRAQNEALVLAEASYRQSVADARGSEPFVDFEKWHTRIIENDYFCAAIRRIHAEECSAEVCHCKLKYYRDKDYQGLIEAGAKVGTSRAWQAMIQFKTPEWLEQQEGLMRVCGSDQRTPGPLKDGPGYAYFVYEPDSGHIKIGHSTDPENNLKSAQRWTRAILVYKEFSLAQLALENYYHKLFGADRLDTDDRGVEQFIVSEQMKHFLASVGADMSVFPC
jgi:hypothetical protein